MRPYGWAVRRSQPGIGVITDRGAGVFVEHVETGLPLGNFESRSFRDGAPELAVRVGPVRVVAVGLPWHDFHHGTLLSRRRYGRTEAIVQVKADGATTARLELTGNGGHLEVTLKGKINETDEDFVAAEMARLEAREGYVDPETRELLPPGTYTLRATFPLRPAIEVGVTITDGEPTQIELDFGG